MARSKDLATKVVRSRHYTAGGSCCLTLVYMLLALWVGLKASLKASVIPADAAEQRYASGSLVFQPVSHVPVRLSPKAVTVSPLEAATIRCMS